MSKSSLILSALSLAFAAAAVSAAEQPAPEEYVDTEPARMTFGGDLRIRNVHFDQIPISADPPGVTRGGENHFWRFRTRLWTTLDLADSLKIYARAVNEFRHYHEPDDTSWEPLDDLLLDALYADFDFGAARLRVGRQDLIYGTGKVLLEGTPKDGSRTIYMDAVKLSLDLSDAITLDAFGIYNRTEAELVLNDQDRDLTGLDPAYNDLTESGGGLYLKSRTLPNFGTEAYYIYKRESDWIDRAGESRPAADIHTGGFRLMPRFGDSIDANLEVAVQTGERGEFDQEGLMVDAVLNWHLPVARSMKPCIGGGWYYLSGDDPDTAEDEGWDPLWARWPQYSELYIYAFDADGAGRWSNVSMPHADLSMLLPGNIQVKALAGYLYAVEENGPGGGDKRGFLATARADFTLAQGLFCERDRLGGHLLFEWFDPDNYYLVEEEAHFARVELTYGF